ncbi:unnamed protein product [Larinioides sclopetarius]|uniref:Uncharacterized protein n=1 Tax=Larinioides sclopetarius TaxID=280406 RepID=A0AAV1ZJZ6_9ARAC
MKTRRLSVGVWEPNNNTPLETLTKTSEKITRDSALEESFQNWCRSPSEYSIASLRLSRRTDEEKPLFQWRGKCGMTGVDCKDRPLIRMGGRNSCKVTRASTASGTGVSCNILCIPTL